ncbi:MAG TPA: ACP S-malonyltransferase [Candidatus Kapabacteria bacterium]|nr:ACP S-malonyltransferase [Candidatus Kapabacteria bacterium]
MKTALVFSGQGSQYVGMLKDVCSNSSLANEILQKANSALSYNISDIMFDGPIDVLKETRYTQPAIYIHSSILFNLLNNKLNFDACAGHSVGEFAALYAAGVIDLYDGLMLVAKRGELMFSAGIEQPGTMFAVIGLEDSKVEDVCHQLTANGNGNIVVAANFNSPGQVVVSGSAEYLRENASAFKTAGAKMVKELVVSGAFHSPLLNSAKEELALAIHDTKFNDAIKPIYSNVYAKALYKAEEIKEALILQLTSPVKWTQSIIEMKNNSFTKFIEIGPGNVLQGLIKRTISDIELFGIDKYEDIEKYQ